MHEKNVDEIDYSSSLMPANLTMLPLNYIVQSTEEETFKPTMLPPCKTPIQVFFLMNVSSNVFKVNSDTQY